jgi:hypothetical protein
MISTVQTVINGNIDDANIKAGAAIASSKLATGIYADAPPTWAGLTVGNGTNTGRYV